MKCCGDDLGISAIYCTLQHSIRTRYSTGRSSRKRGAGMVVNKLGLPNPIYWERGTEYRVHTYHVCVTGSVAHHIIPTSWTSYIVHTVY